MLHPGTSYPELLETSMDEQREPQLVYLKYGSHSDVLSETLWLQGR